MRSTPGLDPLQMFSKEEFRTLGLGSSGGSFLVPGDTSDAIVAAARAQSAVALLALEIQSDTGETMVVPTASTPKRCRLAGRFDSCQAHIPPG